MPKNDNMYESSYSSDIVKRAKDLLHNGDPLEFILGTWGKWHVGDRTIGEICACAVAATYITNSDGLHVKLSGTSGKGKSDAAKKFVNVLPEDKCIAGSVSGKAMYYNPNLTSGTIIFTDDADLNEDVITTIKTSTTNYQSETVHRTVKKQEYKEYNIPSRISWWMTSVDGFDDDQMSNRFLGADVIPTHQHDLNVLASQQTRAMYGIKNITIDNDVLICRCMYDIIGSGLYKIACPFARSINWSNTDNYRNFPMFMDIMYSVTLYKIFQREQFEDCYLTTTEDFDVANTIYKKLAESNATNLTADELKIMRYLSEPKTGEVDIMSIANIIGKSRKTAYVKMHGKKDTGGLLNKVNGLDTVRSTISITDARNNSKRYYRYSGNAGLQTYSDVAALDLGTLSGNIELFKTTYSEILETIES